MTDAQVKTAFGDDVELGDFTGCESEEDANKNIVSLSVKFNAVTAIEANHPYIVKASKAVSEFAAENVTIDPEDNISVDMDEYVVGKGKNVQYYYNSFVGTYVANTEVPNLCLFLNDNKFWYSTGQTKMKGFRGYFDFYDVLTTVEDEYLAAKVYIDFGGETTHVGTLQFKHNNNGAVYSLDGKKVGDDMKKLNRGVYIQNGKKVVK